MDNNLMIPEGFEVEYSPKESTNTPEGFDTESIPEGFEIEAEQAEEQMPFPDTELSASPKRTVVDGLKDAWQFVTEVPVAAFIEQNRQTEAAELRTKGIYLRKIGKDLSEEEKQRISELDKPFNSGRYNAANNYGIYSNFIKNDKGEYIAYGADVSVENTANSIKQFYADVMKQTAIMYSIGKEGGIGAVAGYVAGGALGGITTKSLAGASAGGKAGASLLARTAVAKKSFELEAGFMRQELEQVNNEIVESGAEALKENEIDNLSIGVGAINASLEMLGLKTVLSAIPKGKEILKNFEAEGVKNLVKSPSFRQAYKEFAARRALASIEEGSTEALQETVNFLASNMAKKMRDVAPTPLADKIDEILYAGLLGAVCSFAMGGVGTTAQVANVKVRQGLSKKQAQKEASEMSLDERLEFANENISTLAEIATEEADNTLNAIKAGVTYDRYKEELKRQGTTEEVADNAAQLVEQLHNVIVDKFGEEGKEQLKKSDLQIVIDKNNENQIIKEKDFIESEPEIESSLLQTFKPEELQTDAATFQYKEDSDAEGVTSRLQGVEKFDPLYSGKIIVYETKDGQKYVVDGHQRLGLAKRLNDPNIRLQGYVFKEADGYTPQDVRVMAAQKNIAEGSGTAVDTAKIIREVGVENMPASISKNSALYREGVSLARLGDEAFQKVINKEIDMGYAARVADAIRNDEAKQALAIDLIAKGVAQGRIANQEMAYGVAAQINSADTTVSEQTNLFGTEEVAQTLYIEKAQIVNRAIKNLDLTKTSLSAAVRNKGKLEKVGENKVDEASSKAVIAENKIAKAIIEKLAYTVGEISDKANELSEKLSEQEISLDEAAKEFNNFVKSPEIMKKVAGYTKKEIKTNVVIIDEALNNPPELTEEEKKAFADLEEGRKNRDKYVNEVIKMIEENNLPSHEEAYKYSDMDLGLLRIAIENAYSANDLYKKHIEKLDAEKAKKLARVKSEKKKAEIEEKFQKDGYDYAKEVLENTRKEIIRRIKRDIADFDMSEKDRKKLVKYDQEALISDEENDETFFTPLEFYQEGFYQDTAEVYLPETEYFKTWFKDSKVVDEDGKPLVMYHGTDAKFEAFDYKNFGKTDNGTRGKGFYFTDEKYQAQKYGNKLYSVYLNMQKPLRLGRNGEYATLLEFVQKKLNIPEIKNLEDYEKYGKLLLDSEDRTKLVKESGYDGIIDIPFNGAEKEYVVFEPEQIKSVDNVGTFNPNSPNIFEQSAYHGSPYNFEKFDTSKMGTGEGQQVHGWGLYFANSKEVAEEYRDVLAAKSNKFHSMKEIQYDNKTYSIDDKDYEKFFALRDIAYKRSTKEKVVERAERKLQFAKDMNADESVIKHEEEILDFIKNIDLDKVEKKNIGQLYKVDIPEDIDLLDEDVPFTMQLPEVQDKLIQLAYDFTDKYGAENNLLWKAINNNYCGNGLYSAVDLTLAENDTRNYEGPKSASLKLNEYGIKGITYMGGSDGLAYVIFDDKNANIVQTFYQDAAPEVTDTPQFKYWSDDAPYVSSDEALDYDFRTGEKVVVDGHHGTKRKDRVGSVFLPEKATSGPMAFFSSNRKISERYAEDKQDTSLANELESYYDWYKIIINGQKRNLKDAWNYLTAKQKATITEKAPHITMDENYENIVYNEDVDYGLGEYNYKIKRHRGNALSALVDEWLESGNLFDEEEKFEQILKLAGLKDEEIFFEDPNGDYSGVFDVYISFKNPLVTNNIPEEVMEKLEEESKKQPIPDTPFGADFWDKKTRNPIEWIETLKEDTTKGESSHAWTSIPDWVTNVLKEFGFDGIIDMGGKLGGEIHKVYIPFESTQIKSKENRGSFDPTNPNIYMQSAWNGSPSRFAKFSTDFIGTGEGNQAHGWGIYFAQNKATSERYKANVNSNGYMLDGKFVKNNVDYDFSIDDVISDVEKNGNVAKTIKYYEKEIDKIQEKIQEIEEKYSSEEIEENDEINYQYFNLQTELEFLPQKIEFLEPLVGKKIEKSNTLYEADIPETDVMLDEDKTFAEQPEKVQAAIKKIAKDFNSSELQEAINENVSGRNLYVKIGVEATKKLELDEAIKSSPKKASELLNMYGVQGITYYGAEDGRCFVVFDDKAIRIMNTYYQFAGENSQTADQNSLSNAKSMLKKGTPAGVVREETGWFIGADGKWRYEISDDDAILDEDIARYREPEKVIDVEEYENKIKEIEKPLEEIRKEYYDENISHSEMMAESQKYWDKSAPLKEAIENYQREVRGLNVHKLGDILDHEKLYAAYPELRNLRVVFQPDNSVYYGMFSDNTLYLTQRAVDEGKIKATLMHEIQHYIQGKERFATGGNTSNIKADIEHGLIKLQRTEGGREYYNKIWKWEDLSEEEARIAKALQVAKVAENPEHLFKTGWWAKNGTMFKPKKTSKDYKAFVEEWFEKYNDSIRESLETPLDIDRHREYIEMDIKELQKLYNNTRAKEKYAYQNIMNFKTKNSELVTHIETLKKAVSELQQAYQAENDYEVGKLSLDDYKRLAGEVEARNTEARMNMTESERKANDYTKTQDVSNADQLIVFSDGSTVPFSAASMEGSQGPKKSNGPRGRFRIDENGGAIIEVLENGDASTIVHELGHYYLYSLEQLAQTNKRAEKELKDIYDYLGREIGKEYSRDDQVEFHEKFARSFEAYLMNGKAPTKKMKTAFEHFKDWLKDVYNSLKDLNVDFSEESIKLFDRIFTTDEEYEKEVLPKYEYNYNKTIEIEEAKNNPMYQLRKFVDDSKTGISTWYDKLFIPLDSRLSKISPELAMKLRKHTAALSLVQGKDFKVAEDFFKAITKIKKASEEDYYTLDLALKNRDSYTVNRLANKYDFVEEMDAVRDMLDDIRDEALEVGINVGYLENYYPREVKRDMLDKYLAFIDALKRKEDIDVSKQILSSEDAQISLILDEMKREKNSEFWTQEDIAKYINSKLRGFGRNNILLSRSGNLKKSRGIDELNGDFNQFYETMEVALINYISGARKTIEARKFFGNENAEVGKLRATIKRKKATLKEVEERTPSQAKYKEIDRVKYELAPLEVKLSSLQKQEEKEPEIQELQDRLEKKVKFLKDQVKWLENSNPFLVKGVVIKRMKGEITEAAEKIEEILGDTKHIEDSIGQLVQTLAANGDIIAKDEKAIREMLTARFAAQSISDPVRLIRDMTYIATLNDITNAITQFGDLAFSVYKYGFKNTAKSFGRPFGIKKEDLGLNDMAYEFSNPSKLSKWIKTQFKWIGLDKIDGMGKNTIIQASILNAQEKIKKNDKVFDEKLQRIFGKDSEQVKKELLRGEITDNTIIFAFHELAEIQPISEDQTPELYNNGGGFMRLFYTLKTYGIKALDIARQDVTIKIEQGIKKQDKKMVAEGLKNLIRLQMLLWLFGVPIDALKDLLSNRDINLFESFIDSLIPAFLVNRYAFRTAGKEGVGAAVVDYFTPSMASVVERLGKNYAVTNIPFIGKPLYNWGIK